MAEVNQYRGKKDLHSTLGDMLREAKKCITNIKKEYLVVQQDMADSMNRIERAGLYNTLHCQMCRLFKPPVILDHHYSPEPLPLTPCTWGPAEMPVLMEGNLHRVRCFCCKKQGHKAQECPQKKHRVCTICHDHGHCKAACHTTKGVR